MKTSPKFTIKVGLVTYGPADLKTTVRNMRELTRKGYDPIALAYLRGRLRIRLGLKALENMQPGKDK